METSTGEEGMIKKRGVGALGYLLTACANSEGLIIRTKGTRSFRSLEGGIFMSQGLGQEVI